MTVLRLVRATKMRGARRVLDGESLAVRAGEAVVVTGPNGAGKSTLLAVVAGVLALDGGSVDLTGTCGYAASTPDVPDHLTPEEWLALVASLRGTRASIRAALADAGLFDVRARPSAALSAGQRQRISLAAAFLGAPTVLVLDEPETSLDAAGLTWLVERLRGVTCLIATHDPTLADRLGARVHPLAAPPTA